MRKGVVVLLVVGCMTLAFASGVSAFDGQRKGFILGFGLGAGMTSFEYDMEDMGYKIESDGLTKFGVHTDFKIGAGLNEQVQLYWSAKVAFFSVGEMTFTVPELDQEAEADIDATVAHGIGGLGITYFFQPVAPSPYIVGTIGFSSWQTPFESGSPTWIGFGLAVGMGYEFAPHWSVEGTLTYGSPSGDKVFLDGDTYSATDASTSPLGFRVTVNALAY